AGPAQSTKDRGQRSPIRIDIQIMAGVGIHHTQQNFRNDATTERSKTFAPAKSANPEQLRFPEEIIPKRRFFVHPPISKKFIVVFIKSDLALPKRLHTPRSTRFLP